MNINSINLSMGASWGAYSQKLTQETQEKLENLGITVNGNISEQEGKRLLKLKEASKNSNSQENKMFQHKQNSNDLIERAKKLATRIGIQIDENVNFKQLLTKIESVIEEKINSNKTNIDLIKELRNASQELANIQAESSGSGSYDNTNQALMNSLEILSLYNKNFLKN